MHLQTLFPSLFVEPLMHHRGNTSGLGLWLRLREVPKAGYHHHQETRQSLIGGGVGEETPFIGKCTSACAVRMNCSASEMLVLGFVNLPGKYTPTFYKPFPIQGKTGPWLTGLEYTPPSIRSIY